MDEIKAITKAILVFKAQKMRDRRNHRADKEKADDEIIEALIKAKQLLKEVKENDN